MAAVSAAVLLAACGSQPSQPSQPSSTGDAAEVYDATTPCDPSALPLPQIPAGTECELAIWHVELRTDGIFTLATAYGMSQPNTTTVRGGGVRVEMKGTWATVPHPGPSGLAMIELTDPATAPVRFVRISDHLLHLLDGDGRLMIGNGAWSYTLNRTGLASPGEPAAAGPVPAPARIGISGTFLGRTPCQQAVATFLGRSGEADCRRIKVSLQLNPDTGSSGGFVADAVYVTSGSRGQQAGTWRQTQGAPAIIELQPATGDPLRLLLVDVDHLFILDGNNRALVGDAHHSFTLSRER